MVIKTIQQKHSCFLILEFTSLMFIQLYVLSVNNNFSLFDSFIIINIINYD